MTPLAMTPAPEEPHSAGLRDAPGLHVVRNWEEKTKINHTSRVEKRQDGPALPRSWVWPTEGARAPGTLVSMLVAGGGRQLEVPPPPSSLLRNGDTDQCCRTFIMSSEGWQCDFRCPFGRTKELM